MRFELIPNIPCPHCEKQNTTHRLVRKEDGFTKVSRRCTSCGGEWTHTWDRDWLADAKIKRLSAENIELRAEVERLQQEDTKTRHALKGWVWVCPDGGDEPTHERVSAVVSEVERLREQLEVERMRVVACGAVALADTPESATEARKMYRDCRSASLCTVEFMVDESIALRAENVQLRAKTEQLRDILRCVSVHSNRDGTVKISFFSEGDSVTWSIHPQTSWAREVLAEFEQDRLLALEENP